MAAYPNRSPTVGVLFFTMAASKLAAKRKSAVELLQESKIYYVKSEKVRDSKQEFKHSEHLQVSANPNFDLLHHNKQSSGSGTKPGDANHYTLPPSRRSIPEFKLKAVERKLHDLNDRHHHHNHGHNHHHSNHNHHHGQPPTLPPKSPRNILRSRSKTRPETAPFGGSSGGKHHAEYRRSQSMPDKEIPQDDIQVRLRRLLYTDSKENLSGSVNSVNHKTTNDANDRVETAKPAIVDEDGTLCYVTCAKVDAVVSPDSNGAILTPRQHQDGNYSIHKSMPDLSPTKLGLGKNNNNVENKSSVVKALISRTARSSPTRSSCGCHTDDEDDCAASVDGSLLLALPKSSVDLRRTGSRATSDYVSRSPSCKCEYLTAATTLIEKEINENDYNNEKKSPVVPTVCEKNNNNNNNATANKMNTAVCNGNNEKSANTGLPRPRQPPPPPPKRKSMVPLPPPRVTKRVEDTTDANNEDSGSGRRRPILRSKSDISHRFSGSTGDFVDSDGGSPNKRNGPASVHLESFFGTMGLDTSILQHLTSPPPAMSSPVFFSSTSSIASSHRVRGSHHSGESDGSPIAARSGPAPTTATTPSGAAPPSHMTSLTTPRENTNNPPVPGLTNKDLLQHGHTETSIVERNARVIKWLYNCRKAKAEVNGRKS